jgi:hypothetical protein
VSQFLQVNGDYGIKTSESGKILFDTGPGVGEVRMTGNLIVEGDTLTVSAENLDVNDNVIVLNAGETGAGVSLRYSGIQIDRGSLTPVTFVFDENTDAFQIAVGSPEGTFNFSSSALKLRSILTNADTDDGDLTLIGSGSGVVKVSGTIAYEQQVTDDDDIPNKKYVDDAIRDNPTFQIVDDDTRVIVTDNDVSGSTDYIFNNTGYSTFGQSAVSIIVEGQLNTQFYSNRVEIQGLEISNNEITNNDTNADIFVRTQGTGKLRTNYGLSLDKVSVTPAYGTNSVIFYAKEPDLGDTGLFYVNSNNDNGELINKNRALLFSMIF